MMKFTCLCVVVVAAVLASKQAPLAHMKSTLVRPVGATALVAAIAMPL